MKKLIAAVVIPLAFVAGCSTGEAPAPAPVVTVTEQVPPSVAPQDEFVNDAFEQVWASLSPDEQQESCGAWLAFPDIFWEGFSEEMNKDFPGLVTREQFDAFFSSKCGY